MAETEIPEDVREAAIAALDAYRNATGAGLLVGFEDQVGAVATAILAERERIFEGLSVLYDGWKANPGADDSGAIALSLAMFNLFPEKSKTLKEVSESLGFP